MERTLVTATHCLVGVTGMMMDASELECIPTIDAAGTIHVIGPKDERWQCAYCGRRRKRDLDQCPGCGATEVED